MEPEKPRGIPSSPRVNVVMPDWARKLAEAISDEQGITLSEVFVDAFRGRYGRVNPVRTHTEDGDTWAVQVLIRDGSYRTVVSGKTKEEAEAAAHLERKKYVRAGVAA